MANVAITGVNGFIGGVIAHHLEKNHHIKGCGSFQSKINQRTKLKFLKGHFQEEDVQTELLNNSEIIIHCAALVHLHYGKNDEVLKVNYHDTLALAEQAIQKGVKHFIYFSSIHAFQEDLIHINVKSPLEKNDAAYYNYSKAITTTALREMCQDSGMKLTILFPTGVMGRDNERGGTMQKALDLSDKMPILFLPKTAFDVVDVDDIAIACEQIIANGIEGEYILSGGENQPIIRLCKTYLGLKNKKKMVVPMPMRLLLPLSKIIYFFHKKTDFSPFNMYTLYYGQRYVIENDLPKLIQRQPEDIQVTLQKIIRWKQS